MYENELDTSWNLLEVKTVIDFDGFLTDYTLWYNEPLNTYACILGDADVYSPENTEPDFECDSKSVAYEWFDSYNGAEEYIDE